MTLEYNRKYTKWNLSLPLFNVYVSFKIAARFPLARRDSKRNWSILAYLSPSSPDPNTPRTPLVPPYPLPILFPTHTATRPSSSPHIRPLSFIPSPRTPSFVPYLLPLPFSVSLLTDSSGPLPVPPRNPQNLPYPFPASQGPHPPPYPTPDSLYLLQNAATAPLLPPPQPWPQIRLPTLLPPPRLPRPALTGIPSGRHHKGPCYVFPGGRDCVQRAIFTQNIS